MEWSRVSGRFGLAARLFLQDVSNLNFILSSYLSYLSRFKGKEIVFALLFLAIIHIDGKINI